MSSCHLPEIIAALFTILVVFYLSHLLGRGLILAEVMELLWSLSLLCEEYRTIMVSWRVLMPPGHCAGKEYKFTVPAWMHLGNFGQWLNILTALLTAEFVCRKELTERYISYYMKIGTWSELETHISAMQTDSCTPV